MSTNNDVYPVYPKMRGIGILAKDKKLIDRSRSHTLLHPAANRDLRASSSKGFT